MEEGGLGEGECDWDEGKQFDMVEIDSEMRVGRYLLISISICELDDNE